MILVLNKDKESIPFRIKQDEQRERINNLENLMGYVIIRFLHTLVLKGIKCPKQANYILLKKKNDVHSTLGNLTY